MLDLRGRNVLVLGLGVNQGGVGVARYLVARGANVRVTDMQTAEALAGSLSALKGLPIAYTLGGHEPADIEWAEIVVRNPGVPSDSKWLRMARERDVQIEMEMTLFFRACPAPIVGVTGTKGKTTTTSMIGTLLRQAWPEARLAGNMGRSAVLELGSLLPGIPIAIEISSFQIEGLREQELSPHIAVITNIAEDHLDRYSSFDEYARTKADLARFQGPEDWLVYNRDDPRLRELLAKMPGQRVTFGRADDGSSRSFWIDGGRFRGRWGGKLVEFGSVDHLRIPGGHSQLNALAAIAAATVAGISDDRIRAGISEVRPVSDRIELVATVGGVEYVNDTTATIPTAAIAALQAFAGRPVVVIAGGSEKHVSLDDFASELAARARGVVFLDGAATLELQRKTIEAGAGDVYGPCSSMAEAVRQAKMIAEPGSIVLLSPGCASFGMFRNEFDRGRQFRELVYELQKTETGGTP